MWIHKDCGGEITSEFTYSDAENDYYFPVCSTCRERITRSDLMLPAVALGGCGDGVPPPGGTEK